MNLTKPIPSLEMPDRKQNIELFIDDKLVSLSDAGFVCEPMYFKKKYPDALNDCYGRFHMVRRLQEAATFLPDGIGFKVYDAYRPIQLQLYLWQMYRDMVAQKHPELFCHEIDRLTECFVSRPSYNAENPSVHNTGGAIDLTLINLSTGEEFPMGTSFDDFSEKAHTDYYEKNIIDSVIQDNRRCLYNAMISAGFTNLPSEWWHYDYGDAFWAFYKKEEPFYGGILS